MELTVCLSWKPESLFRLLQFSTFPRFSSFPTHMKIMVRQGGVFGYRVWQFLLASVMERFWAYRFSHCHYLEQKRRKMPTLGFDTGRREVYTCSQTESMWKFWQLKFIVYKLNPCKFCASLQQSNFKLWLRAHIHNVVVTRFSIALKFYELADYLLVTKKACYLSDIPFSWPIRTPLLL